MLFYFHTKLPKPAFILIETCVSKGRFCSDLPTIVVKLLQTLIIGRSPKVVKVLSKNARIFQVTLVFAYLSDQRQLVKSSRPIDDIYSHFVFQSDWMSPQIVLLLSLNTNYPLKLTYTHLFAFQ